MEQRVVSQDHNRYIYYIKEDYYSFYMLIPSSASVNLVLSIMDEPNDDKIKSLPFLVDKVIVIPVVDSRILSMIKQNSSEGFQALEKMFSNVLNLSHQILTYNHLQVDEHVYFDENMSYSSFQTWFIQKYGGRVISYKIPYEVKEDNIVNMPIDVMDNSLVDEDKNSFESSNRNSGLGFVSYVLLGVVVAVASLILLYFLI